MLYQVVYKLDGKVCHSCWGTKAEALHLWQHVVNQGAYSLHLEHKVLDGAALLLMGA